MRRGRLIILLILAVVVVLLVVKPFAASHYNVDALFDTADGIAPGMEVEVAGVPVGSVGGVVLTRGLKARIEMQVDPEFAPFRATAGCRILPEGIISENYVQCDPGTGPALTASGGAPTVPLTHDSTPVSLQQFVDVFSLPVDDRLQIVLDELGIATAGNGDNLNAILRRANPALAQANQVLATVDAQRDQLAAAVGQTDQVIDKLAVRADSVRRFVDGASTLLSTTEAHQGSLEAAINRLPPLLTQVRIASGALGQLSTSGTPLLDALRKGAPAVVRLTDTLPAFIDVAGPAISALGPVAHQGTSALRDATPVIGDLEHFVTAARPTSKLLDALLVNLQQRGGLEYLQDFIYAFSIAFSPYDQISHFVALDVGLPQCIENKTAPGCNRGYGTVASRLAAGGAQADTRDRHTATVHRRAGAASALALGAGPASTSTTGGSTVTTGGATTATTTTQPAPPSSLTGGLQGLLNYLLK